MSNDMQVLTQGEVAAVSIGEPNSTATPTNTRAVVHLLLASVVKHTACESTANRSPLTALYSRT